MLIVRLCGALLVCLLAVGQNVRTFADQLIAAGSEAEREQLLRANSELATGELADSLRDKGDKLALGSSYRESIAPLQAAVTVSKFIADQKREGLGAYMLARSLARLSRVDEALPLFVRAREIFEPLGDHSNLARTYHNTAAVYRIKAEYAEALRFYDLAYREAELAGDIPFTISTLINTGSLYSERAQFAQAAQSIQKGLDLARASNRDEDIAAALGSLFSVAYLRHDFELARKYAEEALAPAQRSHYRSMNVVWGNLAIIHHALHQLDEAEHYYKLEVAAMDKEQDVWGRPVTLMNLAILLKARGKPGEARPLFVQALAQAEKNQRRSVAAHIRVSLAELDIDDRHFDSALAIALPAIDLARTLGVPHLEVRATDIAGQALAGLGKTAEAATRYREAIASIERVREQLSGDQEAQATFMEDKVEVYKRLVEVLVLDKRPAEALEVAEKGKARVVLDTLISGRVDIRKAMTADEQEQESKIQRGLLDLKQARSKQDAAVAEYRVFKDQLYARHPMLRVQRLDLQPVSADGLLGARPDAKVAFIEYVLCEKNAYVFVVTASGTRVYPLPVGSKELGHDAAKFRQQIAERELGYKQLGASLYRSLLGPAAEQLRGTTTWVIVPDGDLWNLPFQALVRPDGRHLLEHTAVFLTPSLTVLDATRRLPRNDSSSEVLVVGAANIASSRQEVLGIEKIYGRSRTLVLSGTDADEGRVLEAAPRYDVLHLAAHGVFQNHDPLLSYLVLAKDGKAETGALQARTLMNLNLKARLVVLSGCETGRGEVGHGEGLIGMTWALFVAGAPTTVASQWKVDAASTGELMTSFHKMVARSTGKAESMRVASLELMKNPGFRHPFYWSGFVVMGQGF